MTPWKEKYYMRFSLVLLFSATCLQAASFSGPDVGLHTEILNLDFDLKNLAYAQLGILNSSASDASFNFTVENWPSGVPIQKSQWNRESIAAIRNVFNTLRFVPFISHDSVIFKDGYDDNEYPFIDPEVELDDILDISELISYSKPLSQDENESPTTLTKVDNNTKQIHSMSVSKSKLKRPHAQLKRNKRLKSSASTKESESFTPIDSYKHNSDLEFESGTPLFLSSKDVLDGADDSLNDSNTEQQLSVDFKEGQRALREKFIQKYYDLSGKYTSEFHISRVNISG